MKIDKKDFSFEESLKYLDWLSQQLEDIKGLRVYRNVEEVLPLNEIVKVFYAVMYIKVTKHFRQSGYHMEFVHVGVVDQILNILQSTELLRHIDMQADGGMIALFNAPMKKDVEDLINLSAQIRSINDVVLTKFHLPQGEQTISIGIEYGPISHHASEYSNYDGIYYGSIIQRAKMLADVKEDYVNISNDIYLNLSEDMQNNLFENSDQIGEIKYFYSPLINIRMRKWVVEQRKG